MLFKLLLYVIVGYAIYTIVRMVRTVHAVRKAQREMHEQQQGQLRREKDISGQAEIIDERRLDDDGTE